MKYLDYSGLSYLWSKIKAYIQSAVAPKVDIVDFENAEMVIAASLTDLNDKKADITDVPEITPISGTDIYNLT